MNIRNNTSLGFIDHTPVIQLNNLYISGIDDLSDAMPYSGEIVGDFPEGSYCPLPEYCLIEDKWKYLASLM